MGRLSFVVTIWLASFVLNGNAAVIEFLSQSDFENAITDSTLFDFDNLTSGNVNLGNSVVFGEATIFATPGRVFSTDQFGAPTIQISSFDNSPLTIDLAVGHTAIGMDVGTLNLIGAPLTFVLTGESGELLNTSHLVADNDFLGTANTTFFGFVSDSEEIRSLRISPTGTAFPTIDNLVYGNAIAVPEPSTIPLLVGLGTAACFIWKRRPTRKQLAGT